MPRAIWTGSISFGLVNVPVKLYPAVHQQDIHFNQFEEGTGARIKYKRVSEKSGREVPWEKIVKGYEVTKGRFITIDPEELEAFQPRANRTVEIEDFVALDEIDPVYYDHTYYLAPNGADGAAKAYALLLQAMEQQAKVAIGRVVLRTKQYLAAIRPLDGVLALSTMLFADEVVPRSDIDDLPSRSPSVSEREVGMAAQIIDSLTTEWDPGRYRDTYREKVMDLIDRKAKGKEIVVEEHETEPSNVIDLLAALEASLAAAKKGGHRGLAKVVDDAIEEAEESAAGGKADTEKAESHEASSRKTGGGKAAKRAPAAPTATKKATAKRTTAKRTAAQKAASPTATKGASPSAGTRRKSA